MWLILQKTTFGARNILFPCNMKNCQAKYKLRKLDLHFAIGKLLFKTIKDDFTNKNKFLQSLFKIHVHVNLIFRTWFCVQVLFISGQIGPKMASGSSRKSLALLRIRPKMKACPKEDGNAWCFWKARVEGTLSKSCLGKRGGKMWCDFPGKAADSRLIVGFNPRSTICKPGKGETMGKHGKQFTKIGTEAPQNFNMIHAEHIEWRKGTCHKLVQCCMVAFASARICVCQIYTLENGPQSQVPKMNLNHSQIHHLKRFNSCFVMNTSFKCRADSKTNDACSHIL